MHKDTGFYDAESARYSARRYPAVPRTYVQSFFLRRLSLLVSLVRSLAVKRTLSVLEVGCADGIILRSLRDSLPDAFSSMLGVDISSQMVETARALNGDRPIRYVLRGEGQTRTFNLVIEVGVLNYIADLDGELSSLRAAVAPEGRAIVSLAGAGSLWHRLKSEDAGLAHCESYRHYEALLKERFDIIATRPVGLFVPHLWKVSALGRALQPLLEWLFAPLVPAWFHEKLYVLRPL